MKRTILLSILVILYVFVNAKETSKNVLIPSKYLIEDYNFMLYTLEASHPNLYAHISKEEFVKKTDEIRTYLNEPLSKKEFRKIILRTIAFVQQGHTMMFGDAGFKEYLEGGGTSFPFTVKYFSGNIYIDENFSSNENLDQGTELIAINGIPIPQVISDLKQYLRIRPNGFMGGTLSFNWARYLWLHYDFGDKFKIDYILPNETAIRTVNVEGINKEPKPTKQSTENFIFKINKDLNIAEMVINTFYTDFDEYNSFLEKSFLSIKKNNIQNLIIDLRSNGGGNESFTLNLLDYLTDKPYKTVSKTVIKSSDASRICYTTHPIFLEAAEEARKAENDSEGLLEILECLIEKKPGTITEFEGGNTIPTENKINRFEGNLYLLTSHRTFSAATLLAGTVKDNKLACIIGEETSDGPSSYGCIMLFELPNTKINIQNSTLHKIRAAGYDDGRGVIPDYIVNLTYSDYLKKNDKILNYTHWLIEQRKN